MFLCDRFAIHFDREWRTAFARHASDEIAVHEFTRRMTTSTQPSHLSSEESLFVADIRIHVAMLAERVHAMDPHPLSEQSDLDAIFNQLLIGEFFRAFYFRLLGENAHSAIDLATLRDAATLVDEFRLHFQHIVAQQVLDAGLTESAPADAECAPVASPPRGPGRPVKLKSPSTANADSLDTEPVVKRATIIKQQTAEDAMRVLNNQKKKSKNEL